MSSQSAAAAGDAAKPMIFLGAFGHRLQAPVRHNEADLARLALANYGHVIRQPPQFSVSATLPEWSEAIRRAYDQSEPRTAAVLQLLETLQSRHDNRVN